MEALRRMVGITSLHAEVDTLRNDTESLNRLIDELRRNAENVETCRNDFKTQTDHKMNTWSETFEGLSPDLTRQNETTRAGLDLFRKEKFTISEDYKTLAYEMGDATNKDKYLLDIIYSIFGYSHQAGNRELLDGNDNGRRETKRQELRRTIEEVAGVSEPEMSKKPPRTSTSKRLSPGTAVAPEVIAEAVPESGAQRKSPKSRSSKHRQNDKQDLLNSASSSGSIVDSARYLLSNISSEKSISITLPKKFTELGAVLVSDTSVIVEGETNARLRLSDFRAKAGEKTCLAQQSGLRIGDIIGGVNGSTANTAEELVLMICEACSGAKSALTLYVPQRGPVASVRLTRTASGYDSSRSGKGARPDSGKGLDK
jgi:FtsZ-binding cell division protein ZapB